MLSRAEAEGVVERFPEQRILVVGDLMLDRYVSGSVSRLSPEAPVPVVHVTRDHALPGGAANVALNIRALGAEASVAGILGTDSRGDELLDLLAAARIGTEGVLRFEGVQTPVKTRVVAGRQQVVRVDREDPPEATQPAMARLGARLDALIGGVQGVIIEDYGKGSVAQPVVDAVLKRAQAEGVRVGLDPKDNHDLRMNGIALATPNYAEACAAAGLVPTELGPRPLQESALANAGPLLRAKWGTELLLITLGPHGMYLLGPDGTPRVIPTRAREVFDVSGAGDTVIGCALLALASGAGHEAAAVLANYAAGVVVGKLGTATCSPAELLAAIEE